LKGGNSANFTFNPSSALRAWEYRSDKEVAGIFVALKALKELERLQNTVSRAINRWTIDFGRQWRRWCRLRCDGGGGECDCGEKSVQSLMAEGEVMALFISGEYEDQVKSLLI